MRLARNFKVLKSEHIYGKTILELSCFLLKRIFIYQARFKVVGWYQAAYIHMSERE